VNQILLANDRHAKKKTQPPIFHTKHKKAHLEDLGDRHEPIGDAAKESVHAAEIVDHVVHQQYAAARAILLQ